LARRLPLCLLRGLVQPRQQALPATGATPLPFLGTRRLLKFAPMLGMPFPLGMMFLLGLLEMAPLLGIALLPETASLRATPPALGMLLRLEMAPLRGMVMLLGTLSLQKMMFQRVEAQNHQGQKSLAFRMTPAAH
jgi:hypothetical protein